MSSKEIGGDTDQTKSLISRSSRPKIIYQDQGSSLTTVSAEQARILALAKKSGAFGTSGYVPENTSSPSHKEMIDINQLEYKATNNEIKYNKNIIRGEKRPWLEEPQEEASSSQYEGPSSSSKKDSKGKSRTEQQEKPELIDSLLEKLKADQSFKNNMNDLSRLMGHFKKKSDTDKHLEDIINHITFLNKYSSTMNYKLVGDPKDVMKGLIAEISYIQEKLINFKHIGTKPFKDFLKIIEETTLHYNNK